jgi:hypothetical protein
MDEKYPDQGPEREGQDLDPERAAGRAPADGDTPPPAGGLPATGDDRVDAALAGLSRLPGRPADEHVAVLEEVHGRLRDILGELNGGPS